MRPSLEAVKGGCIKKKRNTFAPPSAIQNISQILEPGEGQTVEVVIAWKERILKTYHFSKDKDVFIGPKENNDIDFLLDRTYPKSYKLLSLKNNNVNVFLKEGMKGEVISKDKTEPLSKHFYSLDNSEFSVALEQGQMIHIELEAASIYIRFVSKQSQVLAGPFFAFTKGQTTAILSSFVAVFALFLMMSFYIPPEKEKEEEKTRVVKLNFKKQIQEFKKQDSEEIEKAIKKIEVRKNKKVQKRKRRQRKAKTRRTKKPRKIKASPLTSKTNRIKTTKPSKKVQTSREKNVAPKGRTGVRKNISQVGVLGALSSKGVKSQLEKTLSNNSDLQNLSERTARQGSGRGDTGNQNLDLKLKDVGSGTGTSTVGFENIKTPGEGVGGVSLGVGGTGTKANVQLEIDGEEENFLGNVNREAVLRQLRKNKNSFEFCYEKSLKKYPDLEGKIVLQWVIVNENGIVKDVQVVKNEVGSRELASCMRQRLGILVFPGAVPEGHQARIRFGFFVFKKK